MTRALPDGVEVYDLNGPLTRVGNGGAHAVGDGLLRFIDDGQFAHYLIGDAKTSPERPSNATCKIGLVAPHSAFTPHAHGGEHFVLSLGYAGCGLFDQVRGRAVRVRLTPGMMIRIPAMLPHSFANRGARPLLILAANTGYGIDHEDYAVTAAEAERRGESHRELAAALRALERGNLPGAVRPRERLAAGLRRLAVRLERP